MHATITGLLESYGYVFLFVLVGLESLGVPLPGETALVTAAAYAALGHLNIYAVVVTAAIAAIVGDNGGYWIGRRGGLALVRRWGRVLHINESHLERAHDFFQRHGGKTVFIGRFVALLRTWAAVLAGAANMRYGIFLVYNALGGVLWAVLFGVLGYVFGRNLPRLEQSIGQASLAVALLIALIIALAIGMRWFRDNASGIAAHTAGRTTSLWQRLSYGPRLAAFRRRHPRAWHFLSVRFARGEYLGLHLTVGLLVALSSLWLFSGITEDVVHHDPLTQLDLVILHWFRQHATPTTDTISSAISLVGSPVTMAMLAVTVGVVLIIFRRWLELSGWLAAFVGGGLLDFALKHAVQRPRPPGASAFLHQFSYSFPSGHAMGSVFGYGMLTYLVVTFWLRGRTTRKIAVSAAALLVLAIGVSRLYLGVHYFSDVAGGYAAGLVWLAACVSGVEIARRQPHEATG